MPSKSEDLSEGWVKFVRVYCKDGYIDRWIGDCIDDPNNEIRSTLNLNSMVTYYRLNGEVWIHQKKTFNLSLSSILEFSEEFTAEEIWLHFQLKK